MTIKEPTIQDVIDSSSTEQRDLMYLVIGAAVSNEDLSDDSKVVSQYNDLSVEQKEIINFIVGAELGRKTNLEHEDKVSDFLSHFGVKGMKWGVVNSNRGSGRSSGGGSKSSSRSSSTQQKSKGRRVTNAILGDKTYWKRTAVIAGVSTAAAAGSILLPAALPAATLVSIGQYAGGAAGLSGYATTASLAAFGSQVVATTGLALTSVAAGSAQLANSLSNFGRAITGNQKAGANQVSKTVNGKIKHSDVSTATISEAEEVIAHYGIKGMKWGFRRTDAQLAKARTDISPDAARAQNTMSTIKSTKSLSSVSDADLNHLINRINTEKRYSEAVAATKGKPLATTHKGIKAALGAGKTLNTAITFARSPAGRLLASKLGLSKAVSAADKAQKLADLGEMARPKGAKTKTEDDDN
jgi:hypothetical protein